MEPPTSDYGVCRLCGAPTRAGFGCCFCCAVLVRQLRMPLAPLVAIAGYRVGDGLHRLLRGYKDDPSARVRARDTRALVDRVDRWLALHGDGLRRRLGPWDLVVTVPSSHRTGRSPVDALAGAVPGLASELVPGVLVRGPARLDHLVADRRGFRLRGRLAGAAAGCRALVVDDTVTTGARAQSAVAALRVAGFGVAGVLVVGRALAPEAAPWQAAHWAATGGRGAPTTRSRSLG